MTPRESAAGDRRWTFDARRGVGRRRRAGAKRAMWFSTV